MSFIELSIVIPVYNEESNLLELYKRLKEVLENDLKVSYEIIFVDDGSKDNSWEIIENLHVQKKNVKGLKLSRNFGHQYALKAGLDSVEKSRAVITMDADLQHPPDIIVDFYNKWKEGYKIIQAIRTDTIGVSSFKKN